jgi:lipopolysaccharide transport protein LptA
MKKILSVVFSAVAIAAVADGFGLFDVKGDSSSDRNLTGRPARITSATTYYDRKEGIIFFDKDVYVDDEQYQLHADRAYVFTDKTNDVRRIVAIGHVAMTNDMKRAYGVKVSYYKEGGMVVLYGGEDQLAEVRDESKEQDQVVKGRKIKFWIDSEQVEVMEADITAPTSGLGKDGLKKALGR